MEDSLIQKEISNFKEFNITFELGYEIGNSKDINEYKIVYQKLNFYQLYIQHYYMWIIAMNEVFIYLKRGCSLAFIRDFLASLKNTISRAVYIQNKWTENTKFYSYFFDDVALSLAILKRKKSQINIFSRTHGFETYDEQAPFKHIPFQAFKIKYFDAILPVSNQGANHLRHLFPMYKDKINSLYLGTNSHSYINPFANDVHIVTCAYVRKVKRLYLMPELLKSLDIKVTWSHIGEGDDFEELKNSSKNLPDNIKVQFLGNQLASQIMEFYKHTPITCIVSLSSSEGLPLSMMEAISFGIPIISTDVGGCSEIVTNSTGFLIPKNVNTNDFIDALKQLLQSNINSIQGRNSVKSFWQSQFSAEKNYIKLKNKMDLC